MTETTLLTLKEACVLANVPEPVARREIERKTVVPQRHRDRGKKRPHVRLPPAALVYLRLARQLSDARVDLSPSTRRDLYLFLTGAAPHPRWKRRLGRVVLTDTPMAPLITDVEAKLAERLRIYRLVSKRVHSDPLIHGGDPVFRGTRIQVSHVGALRRRGRSIEEVLEH
jgi:hypothetical protein